MEKQAKDLSGAGVTRIINRHLVYLPTTLQTISEYSVIVTTGQLRITGSSHVPGNLCPGQCLRTAFSQSGGSLVLLYITDHGQNAEGTPDSNSAS